MTAGVKNKFPVWNKIHPRNVTHNSRNRFPMLGETQRNALLAELGGLRKFCISLTGNVADGDDLLQATVERLLEKGMPEDAHVARWAYRVCKNAWIDEVRSRDVRQKYPLLAAGEEHDEPSAEQSASGQRELETVSAALGGLPAEQRLALTLVAVDGKTYAEAAEILEVPVGTIMSRIARARQNLAELSGLLNED